MFSMVHWWRWRPSRGRICGAAQDLMQREGERAFFRSHELAWEAQSRADARQARFWQGVCREISRRIQRDQILRSIGAAR